MCSGMGRSRAPSALSRQLLPQPLGPMRPYRLRGGSGEVATCCQAGGPRHARPTQRIFCKQP